MMKTKLKASILTAAVALSLFVSAILPGGTTLVNAESAGLATIPTILGPKMTTLDTTPLYKWTHVTNATMYQYQVFKGTTIVLDKTPEAVDVCGDTTCQKEPGVTLGLDHYKWRVRARIGFSTWTAWTPFTNFYVSPPPFNSSFNGSKPGWYKKSGAQWATVYSKYLYTYGMVGKYSSIYYSKGQFSDFKFTASVKRANSIKPNYIMVRTGNTVDPTDQEWYPGYMFGYTNDGEFAVMFSTSSSSHTMIQDWTFTPAIVKNGWNTLTVDAYGNTFKYYINGTLVKQFTSTARARGYVGFMTYRSTFADGRFFVDWAEMNVYTYSY